MAEAAAEPVNPENNHLPNEPLIQQRARPANANAANNNNNNGTQQQPVSMSSHHLVVVIEYFYFLESAHKHPRSIVPRAFLQNRALVQSVGSALDPTNHRDDYVDKSARRFLYPCVHSH